PPEARRARWRRRAGAGECPSWGTYICTRRDQSFRRPAAVEHERRAGHQRGGVGGEEDDRAGQLLELAESAELDPADHLVAERLVLEERPRHRRLQEGRPPAAY